MDSVFSCLIPLELSASVDAAAYRWSTGDTSKAIEVYESGVYILESIYQNGCASADTIEIQIDRPPVIFLTEDTLRSRPLDRVYVNFMADPARQIVYGKRSMKIKFKVTKGLFTELGSFYKLIDDDGEFLYYEFTDSITVREDEEDIKRIREVSFLPLNPNIHSGIIVFEEYIYDGCTGTFPDDTVWYFMKEEYHGAERLDDYDEEFELEVFTNPGSDQINVRFSLRQTGEIDIDLYDQTGRKRKQLINGKSSIGAFMIRFDASILARGTYRVVYRFNGTTKEVILSAPLVIQR
ncbi:MAG: hypothetical protein ACLFR2_11940 [Candidatus Kapaibacterium sp.]